MPPKWMCIGRSATLMRFPRFPSSALGSPFVLADFFQKQCRHIAFSHDELDFRRIDFAFVQAGGFVQLFPVNHDLEAQWASFCLGGMCNETTNSSRIPALQVCSGFKSRKFSFINCTASRKKICHETPLIRQSTKTPVTTGLINSSATNRLVANEKKRIHQRRACFMSCQMSLADAHTRRLPQFV